MQELMDYCRNLEPIDPQKPVLVPGDPEKAHMKKCDKDKAIAYHVNQIKFVEDLAKSLNIEPPKHRSEV